MTFERKINQLRSLIEMTYVDESFVAINVKRNNLFSEAFIRVMEKSPHEFKRKLRIKYIGENGVDAGGLLKY